MTRQREWRRGRQNKNGFDSNARENIHTISRRASLCSFGNPAFPIVACDPNASRNGRRIRRDRGANYSKTYEAVQLHSLLVCVCHRLFTQQNCVRFKGRWGRRRGRRCDQDHAVVFEGGEKEEGGGKGHTQYIFKLGTNDGAAPGAHTRGRIGSLFV